MSNALIAFLVALGATVWVYTKQMRRSGGLTRNSLIVAGVAGLFVFFLLLTVLSLIPM